MEVEPVLDRDARIEARRARIKERLGAQKGEGENIGKDGKVIEEESRSKAQISDSRARIDKLKTTGASEVTKVRIIGDSRENERRINEEVSRQGRRQKLLYEAESSARQNAAVAMKWSALFDKEIPQELLHEIELQKDTCERIIQSKDRLIKEFKTELKAKDDEYVKSLKKQNDDVELLLERMTRQFTSLRKTFDDELEEIETSFMQERAELMHSNQQELQALMQKRLDKEEQVTSRLAPIPPFRPLSLLSPLFYSDPSSPFLPPAVHGGPPPPRRRGPAPVRGPARPGQRGSQYPQDQIRDRDPDA